MDERFEAEQKLWLAVASLGLSDFKRNPGDRRAREWLLHRDDIGSFDWICSQFDINVQEARAAVCRTTTTISTELNLST